MKNNASSAVTNEVGLTILNDDNASLPSEVSSIRHDLKRISEAWDGIAVVVNHHLPTNSWIFIAIHDMTLGPAVGGTRTAVYPGPIDGDALNLAEAMTSKWAMIDAGCGGGKAVLAMARDLSPSERLTLLRCFGETIEALRGAFSTAGDLGTTSQDLTYLAKLTRYVCAADRKTGARLDSGIYTALGLRAAIRACIARQFGDETLSRRSILVQGLGQVGGHLARLLAQDGAVVLINDLNSGRLNRFHSEIGCTVVAPEMVYETRCDVYAPCCVGGTINDETVSQLSCRIVCGGANNQLTAPALADKLHQIGILYAPDYVANAGGALALRMFYQGATESEVRARIKLIQDSLQRILTQAAELSESPLRAADRSVKTLLDKARTRQTRNLSLSDFFQAHSE